MYRLTRRHHREYILLLLYSYLQKEGTLGLVHLLYGICQIFVMLNQAVGYAVSLSQKLEVGICKLGERVTFVVEELLPLTYHTQVAVVHQNNLYADLRLIYRTQLL